MSGTTHMALSSISTLQARRVNTQVCLTQLAGFAMCICPDPTHDSKSKSWPVLFADAAAAYGSNLEAGLDGDLEAQDDAAASFNDHYHSARAEMYEEEYDPLRDDDSDDDRGRGAGQRNTWQETPSTTIYVRVCRSPANSLEHPAH